MLTHDHIAALNDLSAHLNSTKDLKGLGLLKKIEDAAYDASRSNEQFEQIAVWAADCQAATAEGYASRKSAAKGERSRHASICKSLREMIQTGVYVKSNGFQPPETVKKRVLERLDKAETNCIKANV